MEPEALVSPCAYPMVRCYLRNLAALYALDPELAARLDALPLAAAPPLEPTRDGRLTARLNSDDGKPIYAHSRYQPLEEARTLVQSQMECVDGDDARAAELENPCVLVAGLGLGYHVLELERRFARPLLIVAEDDLGLIEAAFCVSDLSELLRKRRLMLLTSADKSKLHARLRPIVTYLMLGLRFINLPYTPRYHARFHTEIRLLMRDFVSYSRLQMVSLLRNARITCKNVAFNLPAYVAQPGVEALLRRAAGFPAILVAAGPSLARNIDQLAGLRDRAVIIAVQTVLKTLLALGVPPHFVVSLDYHEISAQFFRGVEDSGDTVLVAEPKATWHVLDTFRGRTHVLHAGLADDLLGDAAPTRGALKAGSTVAHLAFYLAEHLGCDPIILIGQDLSFPDGLYYPPGMPIERIWQPELSRFQTVEMKQWERIVRSRASLHVVKDIHGCDIYTDDQLFTYAEQFQSDFLASSAKVIHASEGGMRLQGTEIMALREAAERFCTRPLPGDLFTSQSQPLPPELKKHVCAAIVERLGELKEIRQIAEQTVELLQELSRKVDRPAEFNRLVGRVDELRTRMQRNERTYRIVVQASQLAELRRLQADRAISDEDDETSETARRRLRRDLQYVRDFMDGCEFLQQMLPQALERLRERL